MWESFATEGRHTLRGRTAVTGEEIGQLEYCKSSESERRAYLEILKEEHVVLQRERVEDVEAELHTPNGISVGHFLDSKALTFWHKMSASPTSSFSLSPSASLCSAVSSFQLTTGVATEPSPRSAHEGQAVVA